MNKVEHAVSYFEQGFSCSQSVFATFGPEFGLDREMALRVSGAFGGGMGGLGETCGAVTGAFMTIGLKYGRINVEDEQAKERTYALVQEFVDRFKAHHGAIKCSALLGYDMNDPEERDRAREQGVFDTLCPKFVRDAADIVERILG